MIHIRFSETHTEIYAGEYLTGVFDKITFLRYKKHNIAIPDIVLSDGEVVVIESLPNKGVLKGRDRTPIEIKYRCLSNNEVQGQGFEIYDIIKDDDRLK